MTQVTKTALYVQNKNSPTHFKDRTYDLILFNRYVDNTEPQQL